MVWKRTRQEILDVLGIQRQAIAASCKAYDEGQKWEALRMATAVHLVVHDGGRNDRSLLTQLGVRAGLRFISSGPEQIEGNLLRHTPLTVMRIEVGGKTEYEPRLGAEGNYRLVQFPRWWEQEKIFVDGDSHLNRRRLVFTLRSQEGGAHFDEVQMNPHYVRMATESNTTWRAIHTTSSGTTDTPILGLELASMRQIAWELLTTLDRAEII